MSSVPPDGPQAGNREGPATWSRTVPTAPPRWAPEPGAGPGAGAAWEPKAPRRRRSGGARRRRAVAPAVLVAVLVAAGLAGALLLLADDADDAGTATGAPTDEPAGDAPADEGATTSTAPEEAPDEERPPVASRAELEAAVAELSEHVEAVRGSPFPEPVTVELLEGDAFNERLLEDFEEEREDVDLVGRLLVALQLLDPAEDLFEIYRDFYSDGVLGFYDPETGELVVRGAAITPYTRSTIVHELTHAYDDQRFELHRPDVTDAEDERGLGFSSLVEGNAVRVQQLWEAELTEEEQEDLLDEQLAESRDIDLGAVPPVLLQQIAFPYSDGPLFVEALADAGGERRIDAAFAAPPTTSEQVIDPEAYLAGEGAVPVPEPPADGEVLTRGSFGQLLVILALGDVLDRETAQEAAQGWGGDASVAWEEGGQTCVRIAFRMDTAADLAELTEAWEDWADAHGEADVVGDAQSVTVTACG